MSATEVINAATSVWKIIEDGKPSSQINSSTANAVPKVDDWQNLVGAKGPSRIKRRISNQVGWPFDNYLNVDIQIHLMFEYGATYNGGGLFIPNIYVEVPECFLGWHYHADIDIHVHNPSNDNESNPRAPIAKVPVSVSGTYGNPFWSERIEWGYTLWGNGKWETN
jgi:hypothetical protein